MAPEDVRNLVSGTSVAATIHALHGRIDISLFAAQVGAKFSGLPEWKEAMRSVAEQVQRMSAEQQAEFGRVVAAMRQGTPDDAMTAPVSDDGSAVPQPPAGRCPRCGTSSPTSAPPWPGRCSHVRPRSSSALSCGWRSTWRPGPQARPRSSYL